MKSWIKPWGKIINKSCLYVSVVATVQCPLSSVGTFPWLWRAGSDLRNAPPALMISLLVGQLGKSAASLFTGCSQAKLHQASATRRSSRHRLSAQSSATCISLWRWWVGIASPTRGSPHPGSLVSPFMGRDDPTKEFLPAVLAMSNDFGLANVWDWWCLLSWCLREKMASAPDQKSGAGLSYKHNLYT